LRAADAATRLRSRRGLPLSHAPVARGLESQVEFADARFPGFFQLANETIKIGNDNPDNIYRNANVTRPLPLPDLGHARRRADLLVRHQGRRLRERRHDGCRRARSTPTRSTSAPMAVRDPRERRAREGQLAADEAEHHAARSCARRSATASASEPARYAIERLGPAEDDTLDPPRSRQRLLACGGVRVGHRQHVRRLDARLCGAHERAASDDQELCQRAGGDATIHYCQSRWQLAPDEALVIEIDHCRSAARGTSSSATSGWSRSTTATTAST
jgi:hypothetical protein